MQSRKVYISPVWTAAFVLATIAVLCLLAPGPAYAGTQVASSTYVGNYAGMYVLGYPGQRKLVRDADGYWYAVPIDRQRQSDCRSL